MSRTFVAAEGWTTETLSAVQVDPGGGQFVRTITFEPDDLDAALAELEP